MEYGIILGNIFMRLKNSLTLIEKNICIDIT